MHCWTVWGDRPTGGTDREGWQMDEELFVKSEIATMKHFLATTPQENVIERIGYQHRLAEAEATLAEIQGRTLEERLEMVLREKAILAREMEFKAGREKEIHMQIAFRDWGVRIGSIVNVNMYFSRRWRRMKVVSIGVQVCSDGLVLRDTDGVRCAKPQIYTVYEGIGGTKLLSPLKFGPMDWKLASQSTGTVE